MNLYLKRLYTAIITLIAFLSSYANSRLEFVGDTIVSMLDEVNVVAAKTGLDYRRNAISGNFLNRMSTEQLGISDVKGMSDVVPNFYIPDYGSRITSTIYVRGIGARMDQPAIGLNIDNVSILNKDAYDFDLSDIASMEMFRGPQSILFGRNTMTGMVNIRTMSPFDFSGWRGGISIGLNSLFRGNLGWYHRFNSKTGLSVVGSFYRYAGNFVNMYNNQPVDREVNGSLRLKFYWNPSRNVNINNHISSSLLRQGGYAYELAETQKIDYNDTCFYKRFLLTDGLSVNANLGSLELISVTSVQHINDNMTIDNDFTAEPYFTLTQKKRETSFTEDVMLKWDSPDGKYHGLTGLYGFYRNMKMTAPVTFKQVGIERLIVEHRNSANPHYPIRWDSSNFLLNSDFKMPSWGLAIYHESRFALGDWHLSVGLRFDYESIRMKYLSQCSTSYTILRNPSGILPAPENAGVYRKVPVDIDENGSVEKSYMMLMPKVSIVRDLPDFHHSNIYLSIGEGYKAGGFNTQMFSDVLQQKLMSIMGLSGKYDVEDIVSYKPEKAWTFEIGGHFNFFDARMQTDISLFYIDCRDQQMTIFPDGETTGRMMTNAARTRSFGGELSLSCNPLERMNIMASYGYSNALFINYSDGINDYKGKRIPYAPSNTLFGEISYDIPCSTSGKYYIAVSTNFTGTGDIYWNESNTHHHKFYGLLGAGISYLSPQWSVELWGKNLTNTKYNTFYFLSIGNEFLQRGRPLMLGVTLRARF